MENIKHHFIYEFEGMKIEAYNTQAEIAEILNNPLVKLISVNNVGVQYRPKKSR